MEEMSEEKKNAVIKEDAVSELEVRLKETEEQLVCAAHYGQQLLNKVQELERDLEERAQVQHELALRLETREATQKECIEEISLLRETLRQKESEKLEMENREKELTAIKTKMTSKEVQLNERIQLLEQQLEEALQQATLNASLSTSLNTSEHQSNLTQDYIVLQAEQTQWLQEKQELQQQLLRLRSELESEEQKKNEALDRVSELQEQLDSVQCEKDAFQKSASVAREEALELQMELQNAKLSTMDTGGKGNSLFAEVEDRRHIVEAQLSRIKEQNSELKALLEAKTRQLHRAKVHNVSLLKLSSSSNASGEQLKGLQERLECEQRKVQKLTDALNLLRKRRQRDQEQELEPTERDFDGNFSMQHYSSKTEYNYMTAMLEEAKKKNDELTKQVELQLRQSLEESDKTMDMTRRITTLETTVARMRADNYQLRMRLEDRKQKTDAHKDSKKKPKEIFEDIKFELNSRSKSNNTPIRSNEGKGEKIPSESQKENIEANVVVSSSRKEDRKPSVSLASHVEVRHCDGSVEQKEAKEEDGDVIRITKRKPVVSKAIDATQQANEMKEQCAQQ